MTSPRRRDLAAVAETVGPYLTDGQIGQAIEYLLRLAGQCRGGAPLDIERARTDREIERLP